MLKSLQIRPLLVSLVILSAGSASLAQSGDVSVLVDRETRPLMTTDEAMDVVKDKIRAKNLARIAAGSGSLKTTPPDPRVLGVECITTASYSGMSSSESTPRPRVVWKIWMDEKFYRPSTMGRPIQGNLTRYVVDDETGRILATGTGTIMEEDLERVIEEVARSQGN